MVKALITEDIPSIVVRDLFVRGEPLGAVFIPGDYEGGSVEVWLTPMRDAETEDDDEDGNEAPWVEYAFRRADGGESFRSFIEMSWMELHHGGRRLWFECMRCDERVGRLFLDAPYFVCRGCAGVQYVSRTERQSGPSRRLERALRVREMLGGAAQLGADFPPRPPGMHRRRYANLREEVLAAEEGYVAWLSATNLGRRPWVHDPSGLRPRPPRRRFERPKPIQVVLDALEERLGEQTDAGHGEATSE
jgi:hypothetical protein